MKKEFIFIVITFFLISFGLILAQENNETNNNQTTNENNIINQTNETCVENWVCEDWSDCINNTKTRACEDLNNCNTTEEKPSVLMDCEIGGDEECEWSCTRWSACINNTQTRICTFSNCTSDDGERPRETKRCRVRDRLRVGECPENCTCTGSTVKCELAEGRMMTVYAGRSGNVIVQIKGVNMSTNVTLYKENNTIYGKFKDNRTGIINFFPDQVQEKIKNKTRAILENQTIELDEDGIYQIQGKKKARLFFLFPVREIVRIQINSETGELIKFRNPWWGFLARDIEE